MRAIVSERGQVTIPHVLYENMGLSPGAVLDFSLEHGRLVAVKEGCIDPIEAARGCLANKGKTDDFLRDLRGDAG